MENKLINNVSHWTILFFIQDIPLCYVTYISLNSSTLVIRKNIYSDQFNKAQENWL